jgi:predicted dehydrogenase
MRIGIAGCGYVTRSFHLPALRQVQGARVTAVADGDEAALGSVAEGWGVPGRHTDAAELAESPEVDVVAVCLPVAAHAEIAERALAAGKHVLVEKPLTTSLADADRLIVAAERSPGTAAVGFNLRAHRHVMRARELLPELGPVQAVRSTFSDSLLADPGLPAWRLHRASGGGALTDKLIHHIDLWRHLLGDEVERVTAVTRSGRSDDYVAAVTAQLRGGAVATALGMDATATENELVIYGERGSLALSLYRNDGLRQSGRFEVPGAVRQRLAGAARTLAGYAGGLRKERRGGDFKASYVTQWRRFLEAAATGSPPDCTLEDGRRALELALAAAESAEQGRPVETAQPRS